MNYKNSPEREKIIAHALTAQTLPEIEAAAQALRQWIQQHSDDLNMETAQPVTL